MTWNWLRTLSEWLKVHVYLEIVIRMGIIPRDQLQDYRKELPKTEESGTDKQGN